MPAATGFLTSSIATPRIFSFIFRPPRSKVRRIVFNIGKWVIPLGSGSAEQLRHGAAFWEILDEKHVHNFVYRIPANFPPIDAKGKTLSGMGTPDLRGTYGTFTFYTDDPTAAVGAVEGGEIVQVEVKNNRVATSLIGPNNTFLKDCATRHGAVYGGRRSAGTGRAH